MDQRERAELILMARQRGIKAHFGGCREHSRLCVCKGRALGVLIATSIASTVAEAY